MSLKPEEIRKLDAYFKRTFKNPTLEVKARPRKDDSCELYVGDEFLGIIFRDDDDGELSYNFSMAILDVDLYASAGPGDYFSALMNDLALAITLASSDRQSSSNSRGKR
jgi:hypothetical protein